MSNDTIRWGIYCSLGLSVVTAVLTLNEDFYTLAGLGFFVFGIAAAIRLGRYAKKERVQQIDSTLI